MVSVDERYQAEEEGGEAQSIVVTTKYSSKTELTPQPQHLRTVYPPDGVLLGEPALNSTKSTETSTQLNSQTATHNTVIETEAATENIPQDPQTTEDEDDAVDALLSLGSDLSQNISADDPLNENALLMPIGAPTIQDINPV